MRNRPARLILPALAAGGIALSLSGCLVADNRADIGSIATDTVQEALDGASSAMADASGALSGAQEDIANALGDISSLMDNLANVPEILTELFGTDGAVSKTERVTIEDAATGAVSVEYTDASDIARIENSFATMDTDAWTLVSSHPDSQTAERTIRFYQRGTVRLGQDSTDTGTTEVLAITTYADSPIIELAVAPIDFTIDLELTQADIDALRSL